MSQTYDPLSRAERAGLELRGLYERYGYRKYRMGQFEEYSLYMDNKNFLSSENVIVFTDLDGRLMALKPDITLSIVRHAAKEPAAAEKLYYNETIYRPSAESHTFKEISQMGMEYIGVIDRYATSEVLLLAAKSLEAFGLPWLLEVSDMRFVVGLLDALGLQDGLRSRALIALGQKNRPALTAIAAEAGLAGPDAEALAALAGLYGPWETTLAQARGLCRSAGMAEALEELEAICRSMTRERAERIQLDFSLAGHTDYYNGVLLRGYLEGLPRAVLTGGRYDNILRKFGKRGGGIGFALDLSEIGRLPDRQAGADLNLLVRYTPDADPAAVAAAVAQAADAGLRVRAMPQGEDPSGLHWERQLWVDAQGVREGGAEV